VNPLWVIWDEAARFGCAVPLPKRGGTWLYCNHGWRDARPGGRVTRYTCLFRTKRLKAYRRHWRRCHGGQ
jgi:hypothetical protein